MENDPSVKWVESWAGKTMMLGSSWHGARPITRPVRPGGPAPFRPARQPRRRAGVTAAAAEAMDAFSERMEFLQAISQLSLAYANSIAQDVPAIPGDANPTNGGETDYASNHHLISANAAQTDAYLQLAEELLMEWGRAEADAGMTASAHSECTEEFCRNPLHPGPCKRFRVPLRRPRRDTGEPDQPAGGGYRSSGANPRKLTGRRPFGLGTNWTHDLTQDTGPEGVPVRDLTIGTSAGPYRIEHGTAWRIDGVAYLVEHKPRAGGPERAQQYLAQVRTFHDRYIRDRERGEHQTGYAVMLYDKPASEGRALTGGEVAFASAGDGTTTMWGTYYSGLPDQDSLDQYLLHEFGHNVARNRPGGDRNRLDHSSGWTDAIVGDAEQGASARVADLRVRATVFGRGINPRVLPGRPLPGGVTEYGSTSPGEDFAESLRMYRSGIVGEGVLTAHPEWGRVPIYFRDLFPERAAQLDAEFPSFGAAQQQSITQARAHLPGAGG